MYMCGLEFTGLDCYILPCKVLAASDRLRLLGANDPSSKMRNGKTYVDSVTEMEGFI